MPRITLMLRFAGRTAVLCMALIASRAHAQSDLATADPTMLGARVQYRVIDLGAPGPTLALEGVAITNSGELFSVFWDLAVFGLEHHVFSWSARKGFVELGGFLGYSAYVRDVSSSGFVLGGGHVGLGGRTVSFLWRRQGDLVTFAEGFGESAVNNAGQVVGGFYSIYLPRPPHAFSWSEHDGMLDLGTLGGTYSFASAVSDAGQVVGWSSRGEGPSHAFSWTAREGMIDLGALGGSSSASAVGNAGHVVGESEMEVGGPRHAFLWTEEDGMIDLGTLGGPNSEANAVNERGAVIGVSDTADSCQHAFFWTPDSGMVDIGRIDGPDSSPVAINQAGVVIGRSGQHAFAWSLRMGLVDLGVGTARSINARGQIAGSAADGHVVLWEPVASIE